MPPADKFATPPGVRAAPAWFDRAAGCLGAHIGAIGRRPPLAVGERIGEFTIVRAPLLGGQGEVYFAVQDRPRRVVAVKLSNPAVPLAEVLRRLLRPGPTPPTRPPGGDGIGDEAQRATDVRHENIVVVYAQPATDPPYAVMEYAAGGTLHGWAGVFREDHRRLVEAVMIPLVEAVRHAHEQGVTHRDIKPTNVLMFPNGATPVPAAGEPFRHAPRALDLDTLKPKLADFGIAVESGSPARPGCGTHAYGAPEQLRDGSTDPAVDLYALGATMYAVLAGEAVRGPHDPPDVDPVPLRDRNPDVDRELAAIVGMCLKTDPADRYASAAELLADLRAYLTNRPLRATGNKGRRVKWFQRNRALVGLAVASVAAAIFGTELVRERVRRADIAAAAEKAERVAADERTKRAEEGQRAAQILTAVEARGAHEATVAAARAAARLGDWPTALDMYRRAIGHGMDDAARLRVERLWGYMATNDEAGLVAELDALEKADLGPLAPKVRLVRGTLLLCDSNRFGEGRKVVGAALDERKALNTPREVFTDADILYAEALVQTRPGPVTASLRKAVEKDALHYPAQTALLLALVNSGQLDAARAHADQLAGLFPAAPATELARALLALLHGDRAATGAALDALAAKVGTDIAGVRTFFKVFADALDEAERMDRQPGPVVPGRVVARLWGNMRGLGLGTLKPVSFGVPTVHLLYVWYLDIFNAVPGAFTGNDDGFRRLDGLAADHPEAFVLAMAGLNRMAAAQKAAHREPSDVRLAVERLAASADRFHTAAASPTLFPRTSTRYAARAAGVLADVGLLKVLADPGVARTRWVRENLPLLFGPEGRRWKSTRDSAVEAAISVIADPTPPDPRLGWNPHTPEGEAGYRDRNRRLYLLGRELLDAWDEAEPMAEGLGALKHQLDTWARRAGVLPGPADGSIPAAPPPRPK